MGQGPDSECKGLVSHGPRDVKADCRHLELLTYLQSDHGRKLQDPLPKDLVRSQPPFSSNPCCVLKVKIGSVVERQTGPGRRWGESRSQTPDLYNLNTVCFRLFGVKEDLDTRTTVLRTGRVSVDPQRESVTDLANDESGRCL